MTLLALSLITAFAGPLDAALDGDAEAIAALRDQGPTGLQAVLDAATDDPRYATLADTVAQQRDASISGLYWYTDLAEAQKAAQEQDKPIVSLRLLGELTSEFSCANSRLFRTVLYSHPEVSGWLREHAVLHWSTERPAPVATIDFGDGRVLRRTITGNSAHIVLDAEGRPLDVIPGLYTPEQFVAELSAVESVFQSTKDARAGRRRAMLQSWHQKQLADTVDTVTATLTQTRGELATADVQLLMTGSPAPAAFIPAIIPMEMTVTKMVMERPMLVELGLEGTAPDAVLQVAEGADPIAASEWTRLAAPYQANLHPAAVQMVSAENPNADLDAMLTQLDETIAQDTAHNEAELHARVHQRFASSPLTDFDQLTNWLYADIFQTPETDPWLGMLEPTAYTGLDHGGLDAEAR
ncbi:MAG: hypothetical protein KC912_08350 [Proteobacteria bacterium]|nr:hypothetical protein [Pseudomonadota bacterium]